MGGRGANRPGAVAKCLFVLIVVALAAILWLGVRGVGEQQDRPQPGSQSLPGQAAKAAGASPQPPSAR